MVSTQWQSRCREEVSAALFAAVTQFAEVVFFCGRQAATREVSCLPCDSPFFEGDSQIMKPKSEIRKAKFNPVLLQGVHALPVPRTSVKATGKRAPKLPRTGKR
jgi:hypothetical protein